MTVNVSGEHIDEVLARLRAEVPLEHEAEGLALLRYECGLLEEARGEDKAALREYLAAYNTAPQFRAPLEALIRFYRTRPSDKNRQKVIATLVKSSETDAEAARAFWEAAVFAEDEADDFDGARAALRNAVERQPEDAASWIELGRLARHDNDLETLCQSIEARSRLAEQPTWRGLLLIELAALLAQQGQTERAASVLDHVAAIAGPTRFRSREVLEQLARENQDHALWGHALEGQAALVSSAVEDDAGDSGVPHHKRVPVRAGEALLRAAELKRRAGQYGEANALLDDAQRHLPNHPLLSRYRMRIADASGDDERAVALAKDGLQEHEGVAVAMGWLRIGFAAERAGEVDEALEAYERAQSIDPDSGVATACKQWLLERVSFNEPIGDHYSLALADDIERRAEALGKQAAASRYWMDLALVSAMRLEDPVRARQALERAVKSGADVAMVARTARALADVLRDAAGYRAATADLIEQLEPGEPQVAMAVELVRSQLLGSDPDALHDALNLLTRVVGDEPAGSYDVPWIAETLRCFVADTGQATRPDRWRAWAATDKDERRADGARIAAAAFAMSDAERRQEVLTWLHQQRDAAGSEPLVATLLSRLERVCGEPTRAADALVWCADTVDDQQLASAMLFEAALLRWHAGERIDAVELFERALERAPQAARLALAWALRGINADDVHARRRAVELVEESTSDVAAGAMERFGLGLASKGGELDAWAALEQLESLNTGGDVAAATALGRILWRGDTPDEESIDRALKQIELMGIEGEGMAAAERYRLCRFVRRQRQEALDAADAWVRSDGSVASKLAALGLAVAERSHRAEADAWRNLAVDVPEPQAEQLRGAAALVDLVRRPTAGHEPLQGVSEATRLMNVELCLPGSDPERRGAAWRELGDALGEEARLDALVAAAWNDLASGADEQAMTTLRHVTEKDTKNLAAWEGLRVAATRLGDAQTQGVACATLGALCRDDARAAAFWEEAGLVLLEQTDAHEDAEIALERALQRDASRAAAFDKLFRRVRARKDTARLLELIDLRLQVTDDEEEITKMYWERARTMRQKGDQDAALACLEDVTMLQPNHVGALALKGEIYIARGDFEHAAPLLAKLTGLDAAPQKQRLLSGIAAVDLYEKRLDDRGKALEVLRVLEASGLSTLKVRERFARVAAKSKRWDEALGVLEKLMKERETSEGRSEAARLALVICRDKLNKSKRAHPAVRALLQEIPDDDEALRFVIDGQWPDQERSQILDEAWTIVNGKLAEEPFDAKRLRLLIDMCGAASKLDIQRVALGCLIALGEGEPEHVKLAARIDTRMPTAPQTVLDSKTLDEMADPEETGALGELFRQIAPAISEALGPSLRSEGVGRRDRVDSGEPLRVEVARWMGAVGLDDFDLYISGKDPLAVKGVAGDRPTLVVGTRVSGTLDTALRAAIAREVFALRRGTTAAIYCDDHTIASVAAAVCNIVGVKTPEPAFAVYREVHRAMKKALTRKMKKSVTPICERIVASGQDARQWATAARKSIDRMAALACADVATIMDDVVGPPGSPARAALDGQPRARHLLTFALSPNFMELRDKLGMGMS